MKLIWHSVAAAAVMGFVASPCPAKAWRGLTPLLTSRAQALEMLGSPQFDPSEQTESFDLPNELVVLRWARPTCGPPTSIPHGEPLRPSDVVLQITVNPKVPFETKLMADDTDPKTHPGWLRANVNCFGTGDGHWTSCTLMNGMDGSGYSTEKGHVTALYYVASDSDWEAWKAAQKSCSSAGAT